MICLPQPVQTVFSDQFLGSCKRLALIKLCSGIILYQWLAYTLPVGSDVECNSPIPCDSLVLLLLFYCVVYRLNYEPGDARLFSEIELTHNIMYMKVFNRTLKKRSIDVGNSNGKERNFYRT